MIIIYVDIILLVVLLVLTIFACGYCFYKVYKMRQKGQVAAFLKPTRVLFRHKADEAHAQLRTVVAYQNPLTGDYCIHKGASPKGYVNHLNQFSQPASPQSLDSGLSDDDAYEPLHTEGGRSVLSRDMDGESSGYAANKTTTTDNNSIDRTWNWQYKEYQI